MFAPVAMAINTSVTGTDTPTAATALSAMTGSGEHLPTTMLSTIP